MELKLSKEILAGTLALGVCLAGSSPAGLAKAGSNAGSAPDAAGCRSCVSQAATLFASNQLEKSSALLRQWTKKCPHNAQLHLLLSTILIRLGDKFAEEALDEAAQACLAQPDLQGAHLQYAMTLLTAQQYAKSAREFETVANLNPGSYEAWSALADLYKRLRKEPEAAAAAEKAAFLEPSTQAVKLAVLQNLKRAGRLVQAKAELHKLIQEAQAVPEVEQSLANEAIQIGAYDEAVDACANVVKAYPKSRGPMKTLMVAEFLKRRYAEAESNADKILADADKSAEAYAIRCLCNFYQGKTAEAATDLNNAKQIDPSSAFVLLADGILKLAHGNYEDAADTLRFASEAYTKGAQFDRVPQSLSLLYLSRLNRKQGLLLEATQEAHAAGTDKRFLATALALESRSVLIDNSKTDALQAAGKLAQQAIALDADNPEALLAQSFCQISAGKFDQAIAAADKIAHSLPADGDRQLLLAAIAAHENNQELEQKELEKGLTFANNDPELLYDLGRLYLKGNKTAEAARLLKQAAEQQVHGPEICFALAEACEKSGNAGESLKYYKQSLSQGLAGENSTQAKAAISRLESSK